MAHVFFQEFGIPSSDPVSQTEGQIRYNTNCLIFEIANNWPYVRWMMDKYRNGVLKQVDPLERDWFNFIIANNMDVEKFGKESDKFIQEYIQKIRTADV